MKALIIYRDFISAAMANTILLNSAGHPGIDVQWNVRPWRVDVLKFPPTAHEALLDAMDTHVIIFAGIEPHAFPFWLQDWLERWAKSRQVTDPVLASISSSTFERSEPPVTSDLARFATRHGLRIIYDDRLAADDYSRPSTMVPPQVMSHLMTNSDPNLTIRKIAPGNIANSESR